jgi:hypothetical protein
VSHAPGVAVQSAAPAGETSYVVEARPEPASETVESNATVRRDQRPSGASAAAGAVLSTVTVRGAESVRLPARSTATARTS